MSKLVPNVVDTARIYRNADFVGQFSSGHSSICLTTRALAFEVSKTAPMARFFADKSMIEWAGGPWFIQEFKSRFDAQKHLMRAYHINVQIGDIQAIDLFSYRTCPVELSFNHPTRHNPMALQLVQKAVLFSIVDEVLERQLESL